ncbi:L,D-transpeptidase family protein [Thiospirillum jenense]|uniref:L,D-transpeptidase family protein n=1 Tax=Thiospirillum jenense TaxID=1653858 RepID=A0A839HGL8_9GAMM|nr:L,D-transpeptidase family protein [Thiospirillum jenense]MBB1126416.1 L,D-transpeptidase family protein [Thiospirillum jenense]
MIFLIRFILPILFVCCLFTAPVNAIDSGRFSSSVPASTITHAQAWTPLSARLIIEFYATYSPSQPLWHEVQARALLNLAIASQDEGFNPDDFHATAIAQLLLSGTFNRFVIPERIDADLLLSDALVRYIHHHRYGKYDPKIIRSCLAVRDAANAELIKADMAASLFAPDLSSWLSTHLPRPFFYTQLVEVYQRYRLAIANGFGAPIPNSTALALGQHDARLPAIRARLALLDGEPLPSHTNAQVYDDSLIKRIKQFQRRSGLTADGIIGARTLAALNVSLPKILTKIAANLERMRWLYNDLSSDFLFVDIAQFQLHLVQNNQTVWTTAVVVGATDSPTPMLRDDLEHVVFNPTWIVPPSIQRTMQTVNQKQYQVFDRRTGQRVNQRHVSNTERYRVVQVPGDKNALGRVKFIFPNHLAVYLHDTPAKHLFKKTRRDFSHGCVRVEQPLELARRVLQSHSGWNTTHITEVLERGRTRHVQLPQHLPVVLYYLTVFANTHRHLSFRPDIYQQDAALIAQLAQSAAPPRLIFAPSPTDVQSLPQSAPIQELEESI